MNKPSRSSQAGRRLPVVRQHKPQRPDDVRGDAPQDFALHQRFAHQAEFMVFEVAQPAMDQLGRCAGGTGAQIGPIAQEHAPATPGGVAGDAATVDASADDGEVVVGAVACFIHRAGSISRCRRV